MNFCSKFRVERTIVISQWNLFIFCSTISSGRILDTLSDFFFENFLKINLHIQFLEFTSVPGRLSIFYLLYYTEEYF